MKVVSLTSFDTCFVTSKNNKETDIKKHKFIMPYVKSSIRKNLEKELAKHDVKLNVILEVETTDLIISSVKREIGTGYVVRQAVNQELKTNELLELKTPYDLPKVELNLVYIEDYLTNLSNYFIKNHIKK